MSEPNNPIPDDVSFVEAESGHIARYGYSPSQSMVLIEFKNGGKWKYSGAPAQELFQKLSEAESAGKFFHANIRGNADLIAEKIE